MQLWYLTYSRGQLTTIALPMEVEKYFSFAALIAQTQMIQTTTSEEPSTSFLKPKHVLLLKAKMLQNPSDSEVKPTDVFSLNISKCCYYCFSDCSRLLHWYEGWSDEY